MNPPDVSGSTATAALPPPPAWLDRIAAGWRGPLLAALVVFVSALPGLLALPPLDRDESRFAQATAQMLESRDFVNIRYQSEPRDKKPVGIHWLQAASVSVFSSVEKREIWAYRIPSLLGAMLAAAACAWGARSAFGARAGLIAGSILGASLLLSSEAFIGKTDAVLCGAVTLMMAGLGRLYLAVREERPLAIWDKTAVWIGFALAVIDKGPVGPMVLGLALLALAIADRRGRWMGKLGWGWGLLLTVAIAGPWALAITVSTDGGFWTGAVGGDLAPKLKGGHESHGAPPGLHFLLAPILLFPATALFPAALLAGWRRRSEPAVRFALAWLVPSWIVFEALPTKLIHYPLPMYGAIAWLMAAALTDPERRGWGRWTRGLGAGLSLLVGVLLVVGLSIAAARYGTGASPWLTFAAAAAMLTGVAGALLAGGVRPWAAAAWTLALGVLTHMIAAGGVAPSLDKLWVSRNAARLVAAKGLDPRNGVTVGPVAVVGYAEPSLVFLLGTTTELDTPEDAADAVADGEPALVEKKQDAAFRAALKDAGVTATPVGETQGLDYSIGKPADLLLYRSNAPPPATEDQPAVQR